MRRFLWKSSGRFADEALVIRLRSFILPGYGKINRIGAKSFPSEFLKREDEEMYLSTKELVFEDAK